MKKYRQKGRPRVEILVKECERNGCNNTLETTKNKLSRGKGRFCSKKCQIDHVADINSGSQDFSGGWWEEAYRHQFKELQENIAKERSVYEAFERIGW